MGLNRCNFIGVLICWCLLFHGPLSSVGGAMGNTIGLYHGVFWGGAVVETVGIKSMVGAIESGSHLNHFW